MGVAVECLRHSELSVACKLQESFSTYIKKIPDQSLGTSLVDQCFGYGCFPSVLFVSVYGCRRAHLYYVFEL